MPGPPGSRKLILLLSRRRLPFSLFFTCYLVPSICSVSRSTGFPPRWKGTLKSEPESTFILRALPSPFLFLSLHLTFARHHTLPPSFLPSFPPHFSLPPVNDRKNRIIRFNLSASYNNIGENFFILINYKVNRIGSNRQLVVNLKEIRTIYTIF